MALNEVANGRDCKIVAIDQEAPYGKLASLGIIPGARIEVLNHCFGTVIIQCKGATLSLGRALSNHLQVE